MTAHRTHNHGPTEGLGLMCPERTLPDGGKRGRCIDDEMLAEATGETRVTSETGGQKGQKLARFDLIPAEALTRIAEVYGMGAKKYEEHNWRRGYDWSLAYAALMRHMTAFWSGEDLDPESGLPHVAHAAFHCLTLLTFMEEQPMYDNRWKGGEQ